MPDADQAWAFLENSDPIASADEVQAAVRRVATQIEARLGSAYPLVLAVMGCAVVFAGQILPLLRFPLDFEYIHASLPPVSRKAAACSCSTTSWIMARP